jgi:hypothetical protein
MISQRFFEFLILTKFLLVASWMPAVASISPPCSILHSFESVLHVKDK